MNPSRAAHDRAMDLAFLADRSKAAGNQTEARRLYKQALEKELEALSALKSPTPVTAAVIHRSAAWLAVECGEIRRAEQLASAGLAGDPPSEIADELRHVWEEANLKRHHPVDWVPHTGGPNVEADHAHNRENGRKAVPAQATSRSRGS